METQHLLEVAMSTNQPPGWAVTQAQEELDSEEYTESDILERAQEIAAEEEE
jgi:hypothetical protein